MEIKKLGWGIAVIGICSIGLYSCYNALVADRDLRRRYEEAYQRALIKHDLNGDGYISLREKKELDESIPVYDLNGSLFDLEQKTRILDELYPK